ncbi:HDOD domain-containing protein [Dasania sp. GY-MA-18]|uniref:HDOD domain-containing protein n=1 Tax=Dasania phycosphaerae TaxID=2950436 RepID=A0A9J6RKM6_9GAMM|nr:MULTISPECIES: HDOD domain-containing protein [Dasania]MCR8922621.1 HDOD domain-containing protein [Dasania sp. GY-MA-18]MCZ0865051.1 HDOD domain-containing protein [Dasania phycosphaerae]MCZ0868777.1 HDOD domain-containing protein [Dasania phycosphaerae]
MSKVVDQKTTDTGSQIDRAPWLDILQKTEMRALASVGSEISQLIGDANTNAGGLAEIILKDAALTSQVLKIANSVEFKPGSARAERQALKAAEQESALRQAIVRIGFNGIRCICISIALIDSIIKKPNKQKRLLLCLAQSFHTAVHARNIAQQMKNCRSEDVFIAGLLQNLGELVFWASPIAESLDYKKLIKTNNGSAAVAAQQLTGMSFTDMSKELADSWSLSETLSDSFNPAKNTPEVKAINLGNMMSSGIESGWDSKQLTAAINKIAADFSLNINSCMDLLRRGADEAMAMAKEYGPGIDAVLLPREPGLAAVENIEPVDDIVATEKALSDIESLLVRSSGDAGKADPAQSGQDEPSQSVAKNNLQQQAIAQTLEQAALRPANSARQVELIDELWDAAEGQNPITSVCKLLANGIYEAIGLERVAVFIKLNKKEEIKLAYLAGQNTEHWAQDLVLSISETNDSIFRYCTRSSGPVWVSPGKTTGLDKLLSKPVKALIGEQKRFMMAPVKSGLRVVALVYTDMAGEDLELSEQHFADFSRLIKQASRALSSQ